MSFELPSFEKLNITQKTIINMLPNSEKLAVIGGPGTGKTIIGIEAASLMAGRKNQCLFLTYSRVLLDFIKSIGKKYNLNMDNIKFSTMHSWLYKRLDDLLKEIQSDEEASPKDFQKKDYVYDIEKLSSFLASIEKSHRIQKYDYIFIDEAQDIQDGLIKVLFHFGKKILVTFDDCQKIGNENNDAVYSYDHSSILMDLGIGDQFFDLIENYRNTTQIESIAKRLLLNYDTNEVSLNKVTAAKEGLKPKLICLRQEDMSQKCDSLAKYICQHYDASKSVGVLFGYELGGEQILEVLNCLRDSIKKYIEKYKINAKVFYKWNKSGNITVSNVLENGIFLMSFKSCKGLEFDEVYIVLNDASIVDYKKKNALYVAFTRAKEMVYLVLDDKGEYSTDLTKLMLDNKDLFDPKIVVMEPEKV